KKRHSIKHIWERLMASITAIANDFFAACETGMGWEGCKTYRPGAVTVSRLAGGPPDALRSFAGRRVSLNGYQSNPLVALKRSNAKSWTDWRPHDHEDLAAACAFH